MARTASRRYRLIAPVMGLTAALLLSGCAAGKISQTQNQVAAIDGSNGTVNRLGVRNALLAATDGMGYPVGAEAPLYFFLTNATPESDTLAGISTPAAAAVTISGDPRILPQGHVEVGAETPVTATLVGLSQELVYGQTIPMTFDFVNAGAVTINVPIAIPDVRTDERPTVNILPEHEPDLWFGEAEHAEEGDHAEEVLPEATGVGAPTSAEPTN